MMNDDLLEGLTDEQIQQFEQAIESRKGGQETPPQFSVALPDGRAVTGTQEEVNRALSESYGNLQQQAQAPTQQTTQQVQQWNQEEWGQKLAKDGRKGMEDYFNHELGFHPKQGFELLGKAMGVINERLQRFERQDFTQKHQGIKEEHFGKLNEIVNELGMPMNADSLENAYHIAKGRGLIEEGSIDHGPQATPQPQPGQGGFNAPPAHIVSTGSGMNAYGPNEQAEIDELNKLAGQMDTRQLGEFLQKNTPSVNVV